MRKTFLVWLFTFLIIAFICALVVSFWALTAQASQNARTLIRLKIADVEKQLQKNQENLYEIRKELDESGIAKAKAVAKMIQLNPALIGNLEEMQKIRDMLLVDEIHIVDRRGILIFGSVPEYFNYDMASDPQSASFLAAIRDPDFALAQDPLPKGINKEIFQYVGVARLDEPGIVQIGYRPEKLARALEIADIRNLAPGFRIGSSGNILILDQNVVIVSSADDRLLGLPSTTLLDAATAQAVKEQMEKEPEGYFTAAANGEKRLFGYKKSGAYYIVGQLPTQEMYLSRDSGTALLVIFNILLFGVIFFVIARLVQSIVINGIYRVNNSLEKITRGNLNEVVSVRTNKEFASLSNGINTTVNALKDAINEASSRIDTELAFAKAIQHSALPSTFPAFPDRKDFDIYAQMYTAKEVGGDFYDFFLVDSDHLAVVIADVSGKGIPASLFMMISKSIIKTYALSGLSVSDILYKSNIALCENNQEDMFVTAFMGILNTRTGVMRYVNAGHNPPLVRKDNGLYEWLPVKQEFVLAGLPNVRYTEQEITFGPRDTLFLYTDGVTEAMNRVEQLYSPKRLIRVLNQFPVSLGLERTIVGIKEDVDHFAEGTEQADDITMLMLRYDQNEEISHKENPGNPAKEDFI
ncbi:MAG: SpoIIE family protein phosphatase [Thermotogae bacterium]|nr:SpoIIE family protein phosphatase [Thermotogota bacterium]